MEKIADNLPDVEQAMRLAREAAQALNMLPTPIPPIIPERAGRMHSFGGEETRFWARPKYDGLDIISQILVERNMYNETVSALAARRAWAQCEGQMAELLKLSRLESHGDDAVDLGTVPTFHEVEWLEASKATLIADSFGQV